MDGDTRVPACRLDRADLRAQLERYRRIGDHVEAIEREPGRLVVRLAPDLASRRTEHDVEQDVEHDVECEVEGVLEVERGCCPFIGIDYDPGARTVIFTVQESAQDPALDALMHALGSHVSA